MADFFRISDAFLGQLPLQHAGCGGCPIRWTGPVPVADGPFADHMWAEPDAEHLAGIFERARNDPALCAVLGAKARKDR